MSENKYDLFLNKFGRYPNASESEELGLGNLPSSPSSSATLEVDYKNDLFIDVTHTVHYSMNSGIQRVVRSLVSAMKEQGYAFRLIKFNLHGQPIALTPYEVDKFYNWHQYRSSVTANGFNLIDSLIQKFGRMFKSLIPSIFWTMAKKSYNLLKEKLKSGKINNSSVVDLRNKRLLLPEIVGGAAQINMIGTLAKHYRVSTSAIFYDMTPVTHPEHAAIGYDFIHYLRIFRSIDSAFAISKYSENELIQFSKVLPREQSKPLITKAVYLGGNFPNHTHPSASADEGKKTILMVARFEPRKNIRRILSAIKRLFEENQNFKFVLVGNPGWLFEETLADIKALQEKNFDIEYHLSVSDTELISWYKKCYFTVFCSITEGFGLPIIESVLMGKPCLTASTGAQAEIAKQIGGCDLADPLDIDDIYVKIRKLLTDKEHYENLGRQTQSAKWPNWSDYAKEIYASINTKHN